MKTILTCSIILFSIFISVHSLKAQDIIVLKNGKTMGCTITNLSSHSIYYTSIEKKAAIEYQIVKSEVKRVIIGESNYKFEFLRDSDLLNLPLAYNSARFGKAYFLGEKKVTNAEMLVLLFNKNEEKTLYTTVRELKKTGDVLTYLGVMLMAASFLMFVGNKNFEPKFIISGAVSAVIEISLSSSGKKKLAKCEELYNSNRVTDYTGQYLRVGMRRSGVGLSYHF